MAFLLYLATALVLLWLTHRSIRALSRAAALILLALPLLLTGYALVTDSVYGPVDHPYQSEPLQAMRAQHGIAIARPHNIVVTDIYSQMMPWRRAVQLSLTRGEWPLWNPWILCGHLLAGAAQPAVFSPFTLLALLLPAPQSFAYTATVAFLIAGISAFLFAREIGCGEGAALVGAIGWMFSTSLALYILWPLGFAWALFPLVLVATRRVVHEPGVASGALLIIALTLMLVAGHPETVLHAVILGTAYAVFELIRARIRPLRPIATALIAGVVTLMLCAIYLLPVAEAVEQSGEYAYKKNVWAHEDRGSPAAWVAAMITMDVFPHLHVRKWVQPAVGVLKPETSSAGSLILAFAIYALWRRRSAETFFFAAVAVLCIAVEVEWGPAANALRRLPLLDITHNERLAFAAALMLSMLAALGVDELLKRRDERVAAISLICVLIALALGTLWMSRNLVLGPDPADWGDFTLFAELFCLGLAILVVLARARFLIPALLALLVMQRAMSIAGVHKTFPADAAYPRIAILDPLANVREPFRIVGFHRALIPGSNVFYGLEDARGYDAVTFAPLGQTYRLWSQHQPAWFNRVDDLTIPFLSFLNVRYAVARDDATIPDGWRRIAAQRGSMLLENTRAIERVFVPQRVTVGLPVDAQLEQMEQQHDFRERAWITADIAPHEGANGPGRVTLVERSRGGEYVLDVDMQRDGWIVISDCAWNGWRAYIDGRRVKTQRANVAFLSVWVPRGMHRVRAVYRPESFVRGRAISALTIAMIATFLVIRRR